MTLHAAISRRTLIAAATLCAAGTALPISSFAALPPGPAGQDGIRTLEKEAGAEIGVSVRDEAGSVVLEWRSQEQFALNSTVKALLAARVVEGHMKDEVKVAVGGDAPHAPVLSKMNPDDVISVKDAARAACSESDNRAANLLMKTLGGPAAMTAWLQWKGDLRTRIDRYEPDCNKTSAYDVRDKTRPSAITQLWRKLYLDFTPDERMEWEDMLKANKHSAHLFKAQVPQGWTVADRTGSGSSDDETNSSVHAMLFNPEGAAWFAAVHVRMPAGTDLQTRDAVLAKACGIVMRTIAPGK